MTSSSGEKESAVQVSNQAIQEHERQAFYRVLYGRRDVRGQFLPDPVSDELLLRLLDAAHHAPSVGFSQPWNFVVIRDATVKQKVHLAFERANHEAAELFEGERKTQYRNLKLQGILDAPVNLCITCDRSRGGKVVLGKTHQPQTDLYSSVCAVQNLWLSARAENVGVGWVSIIEPGALSEILALPENVVPVAYLCIGFVSHFEDQPELQTKRWATRSSLSDLIHNDGWKS